MRTIQQPSECTYPEFPANRHQRQFLTALLQYSVISVVRPGLKKFCPRFLFWSRLILSLVVRMTVPASGLGTNPSVQCAFVYLYLIIKWQNFYCKIFRPTKISTSNLKNQRHDGENQRHDDQGRSLVETKLGSCPPGPRPFLKAQQILWLPKHHHRPTPITYA